jgi:threonylcarbamoyladenosine tRNA methylthiotransferase MtaB
MTVDSTIALDTLGCRLNQAESESLARQFAEAGYRLTSASDGADIYILNTCTVTHIADRKSRHLLRMARRRNPDALIIAVGCYPQRASDELALLEEVDVVLGNDEKTRILEVLQDRSVIGGEPPNNAVSTLRTRSMVKVEEGCSQFCSYCIVPFVRGRERSIPIDEVVNEVKDRIDTGYQEVTLTGTQIGAYKPSLEMLVRRILNETDIGRLRLSSLRPQDLTPSFITLWNDDRLCPHLHLSLQSGSDSVLRRMRRQYSTADYQMIVAGVREAVPNVAITTDIMVGFPGETDEEFEEGYRFCQRMGFANIHVFSYSERPGTLAAEMPQKVAEKVKSVRSKRMLELARESASRFRERFLGRKSMVLWEREVERGLWVGLTENYIRVFACSNEPLRNRFTPARLDGWHNNDLWAVPVPNPS